MNELPVAVVHLILDKLGLKDLIQACCSNTHWHRCLAAVWRPRCTARWRHWASPPPAQNAPEDWRSAYIRRHKADAHILQLLASDAAWPTKKAAVFSAILGYGVEALDVLTAAAQADRASGLYIGTACHARTALLLLQGQLAAQRIKQLLAAEAASAPADSDAAAAAAAAGDGAAAAVSEQLRSSLAVTEGVAADDTVLEVALQLTQALHPMSDICAVRSAIQQLGEELRRRMQAAGATPGSRQALVLLNALLFGQPPAASAGQPRQNRGTASSASGSVGSSSSSSSSPTNIWSSLWPGNPDLGGGREGFQVPTDGKSGLGFKGSMWAYLLPHSSCLDSVLARRDGLPISLGVVHRAVGRLAGLDIQLVNMPGHVVNRVWLGRGSSGSGSSSGQRSAVFVDVFTGMELDEAGLRGFWVQASARPWPEDELQRAQLLPDMSAEAVCRRMLANLCSLYLRQLGEDQEADVLDACAVDLAVPLVQLGPRFCREAFHRIMCPMLQQHTVTSGLTGLFERLLADAVVGPTGLAQLQVTKLETVSRDSYDANLVHRRSDSPTHVLHPISHPVRFKPQNGLPQIGFVVWWEVDGKHVDYYVLASKSGRRVHCVAAEEVEAAPDTPPATAIPLWASDASSCLRSIQQAQRLWAQAWFDADFQAQLAALLQGCGQLLSSAGSCGAMLAPLSACSSGLGHDFEAVWYDSASQQPVLVPNSFVRQNFPEA